MSVKRWVNASARAIWRAVCLSGSVYVPGGAFAWRTFDDFDGTRSTAGQGRSA